jgi:hypothetical protein
MCPLLREGKELGSNLDEHELKLAYLERKGECKVLSI